ncbi:AlpA family transcriptional regulator [Algoriphagus sp. AGSA1]|uniref:helix-turn-helix transcriptional regulator n=1 Tax=Algoriphagus sp. AGSA1 TaxID=2907213 RepID=UPI001F27241A|nr:AlpA family transcriptional regulator [Algoriphagus sp. AGSA1]MCE7056877.1 AlpA family transcriptional regulator [Algoriphagus sp. AGSA1]
MDNLIANEQMRILRLEEVKARTGLSRSTIYHYMNNDLFPASIKLGYRCVGWIESEIQRWIEEKTKAI